jgi:hypothetical protein
VPPADAAVVLIAPMKESARCSFHGLEPSSAWPRSRSPSGPCCSSCRRPCSRSKRLGSGSCEHGTTAVLAVTEARSRSRQRSGRRQPRSHRHRDWRAASAIC